MKKIILVALALFFFGGISSADAPKPKNEICCSLDYLGPIIIPQHICMGSFDYNKGYAVCDLCGKILRNNDDGIIMM